MLATTQALNSDFDVGSLSGRLGGRWGYGRLRRRPPVCVRLAKAALVSFFSPWKRAAVLGLRSSTYYRAQQSL